MSFAFLSVNIGAAVSFIGVITFVLSMVGVKVGSLFGAESKSKAELAGGILLILMGLEDSAGAPWGCWADPVPGLGCTRAIRALGSLLRSCSSRG